LTHGRGGVVPSITPVTLPARTGDEDPADRERTLLYQASTCQGRGLVSSRKEPPGGAARGCTLPLRRLRPTNLPATAPPSIGFDSSNTCDGHLDHKWNYVGERITITTKGAARTCSTA